MKNWNMIFPLDKPRGEPLISSPVNPTEEFALVYENELNNHKILYVAEIDGINSASPVDLELELKKHKMKPNQFIELKTSFEPSEKNDYKFKRSGNVNNMIIMQLCDVNKFQPYSINRIWLIIRVGTNH